MWFLYLPAVGALLVSATLVAYMIVNARHIASDGARHRLVRSLRSRLLLLSNDALRSLGAALELRQASGLLDFPRYLSLGELAALEGSLPDLAEVIIAAERVEDPADTLRKSVSHNFSRGVRYMFLISASHAEEEMNSYYQTFNALARIVIARERKNFLPADLVTILRLPYEWTDYPYIFYRMRGHSHDAPTTLAFRGVEVGKGIATCYEQVEGRHAHTIAQALLGGAPEEVQETVSIEEFAQPAAIDDTPLRLVKDQQNVIRSH